MQTQLLLSLKVKLLNEKIIKQVKLVIWLKLRSRFCIYFMTVINKKLNFSLNSSYNRLAYLHRLGFSHYR